MRNLLYITALLLLSIGANAQWFTTTNFSGTVLYGVTNVTVVGGGSFNNYPGWCGAGNYWIGSGTPSWPGTPVPGWYDYTFAPAVNAIRVSGTAMNSHETMEIWLNGTPYTITPAEWGPFPGSCGGVLGVILTGGLIECTIDTSYGANAQIIIRSCGINSCRVRTSGYGNGTVYTFEFNDSTCFRAVNNGPVCEGDTLKLFALGDSTGATYSWTGPGAYTSTVHNPFRFPAALADSGLYRVIRFMSGVYDTAYTRVIVKPLPVLITSSNSPVCVGPTNILSLLVTPDSLGETFTWSGPSGFTSTVFNPTKTGITTSDSGTYRVIASFHGCVDTAYTHVALTPPPPAPNLSGTPWYCQYQPFTPFTVTGAIGTVKWYLVSTGGTALSGAPVVNTSFPGVYTYWADQTVGSCVSPRSSITVRVIAIPPAPYVTGPTDYCQYKGPVVPVTVTPADSVKWYMSSIGGTAALIEPLPNINIPGALNTWVSRVDSGCEGPRTPVTITIHPKPNKPLVTPQKYCQFRTPSQVIGTPSGAGDVLTWYGPGVTGGMPVAPTPITFIAPDTIEYYVTETTVFGCVSDSAKDVVIIKLKPQPPVTHNIQYCQYAFNARPLNELVDSTFNSYLNWYYATNPVGVPTPNTNTIPGITTWWVSQTVPTVDGCESDSVAVNVTILSKPSFSIEAASPWVCQFDTVKFAYKGAGMYQPGYLWTLPDGAWFIDETNKYDSFISVRFDTAGKYNTIKLFASNNNGLCFMDTTININVVPLPTMQAYTKPDVCLGDTVQLSLYTRTDNAYSYEWFIDKTDMGHSTAMNIISSNSHSSGPYTISWVDTGRHFIKIVGTTVEGCISDPTYDSVLVHNIPDATFRISSPNGGNVCLEDSVQFTANNIDYRNSYVWGPEHDFDNMNKPVIWGKMEEMHSVITLRVTEPFGCTATKSMDVDPDACCKILFPNAFTPNGKGPDENNVFKPYFVGYHRFHVFRIINRWGQTVYESENSYLMAWDGNYNGVPQDMGVYFYYLKYDCGGKTMEAKGDVTLIR